MIKAVLIDIDNTLLDFSKSAEKAIALSFKQYGLPYSKHVFDTFYEINEELWKQIERKEITKQEMYGLRWRNILKELDIEFDGTIMEQTFRSTLSGIAEPVDCAFEMLDHLYGKYPLYAASNSSYEHQQKRMTQAGMLQYFEKMFVSEKVGALKPSKDFFSFCLREAKVTDPSDAVIIGDSLTADIAGGIDSGLKTVWYNPDKAPLPSDISPDFTVYSLTEIKNIL